jgi:hypothetical protein
VRIIWRIIGVPTFKNVGHVLYELSGSLTRELRDGRSFVLSADMSYHVSDFGDPAHQSSPVEGAVLFIVN